MERQEITVRWRPVDELSPYDGNSRSHSEAQIAQIAKSLQQFGWTNPVLIDEAGVIVAGHGRYLAAKTLGVSEIPTISLSHLTAEQRRAYVIADNALAEQSTWNKDQLRIELEGLKFSGFDLGAVGLQQKQLRVLLKPLQLAVQTDSVPDSEDGVRSRLGDVWICGEHRIMCGDSLSASDVAVLMNGNTADLLHADPPYGAGKEADGVLNDNIYGEKLDQFQMGWWRAFRPHVKSNGSAYIWGAAPDLWRLWYRGGLMDSEPLTLRNELVWDKGTIAGMASPELTQYPEVSERCLFIQFGRHVFTVGKCKEEYWPGWDPIRLHLCAERDRAGLTGVRCREICGNHMFGHWFGTSQWSMIDRDNYEKLQGALPGHFRRDFDDLRAEYSKLAAIYKGEVHDPAFADFAAARPYFDNAHDVMSDVWRFPRVQGDERHGHATPKPVDMMKRALLSSTRTAELVAEPFGGSGSTLMAAELTARRCYTMELSPAYVDVIVRRWQTLSAKTALREADGVLFADAAVA